MTNKKNPSRINHNKELLCARGENRSRIVTKINLVNRKSNVSGHEQIFNDRNPQQQHQ